MPVDDKFDNLAVSEFQSNENSVVRLLKNAKRGVGVLDDIIENGRISRTERKIETLGPWNISTIFQSGILEIKLFFFSSDSEVHFQAKSIYETRYSYYAGCRGMAELKLENDRRFKIYPSSNVQLVKPQIEHALDPIENNTMVAMILTGGLDAKDNK